MSATMKLEKMLAGGNVDCESRARALAQVAAARRQAAGDAAAIKELADLIKSQSATIYMYGISDGTPLAAAPLESVGLYVSQFIDELLGPDGTPDLLLRTLAEQVLFAHHTVGRLYCEGVKSRDPEIRRTNVQLAINLTGELRRLIGELRGQLARSKGRASQALASSVAGKSADVA